MHGLWLSHDMETCPAGILHCCFWGNVMSKEPRHPVLSPGRWGLLDVFYRPPNSSSAPLPCLHPCPWLSWRPAHLTQAVTYTLLQPLFSDLHFIPIVCSPGYTHSPPLAEPAASHLETSPAAGLRCPISGQHHPGEGPLGK